MKKSRDDTHVCLGFLVMHQWRNLYTSNIYETAVEYRLGAAKAAFARLLIKSALLIAAPITANCFLIQNVKPTQDRETRLCNMLHNDANLQVAGFQIFVFFIELH